MRLNDERVLLHIGERLKARRHQLNLSQGEVAMRLGVSYQQIQKYERGENRIAACSLYRLAMVLDIPVAWFYEGLSPNAEGKISDPDAGAVNIALSKIGDASLRRNLVELINNFARLSLRPMDRSAS
ncbi:MAG: helix-turn-helix transcriptional regulator [Alphaproteobacteria bacterium]